MRTSYRELIGTFKADSIVDPTSIKNGTSERRGARSDIEKTSSQLSLRIRRSTAAGLRGQRSRPRRTGPEPDWREKAAASARRDGIAQGSRNVRLLVPGTEAHAGRNGAHDLRPGLTSVACRSSLLCARRTRLCPGLGPCENEPRRPTDAFPASPARQKIRAPANASHAPGLTERPLFSTGAPSCFRRVPYRTYRYVLPYMRACVCVDETGWE